MLEFVNIIHFQSTIAFNVVQFFLLCWFGSNCVTVRVLYRQMSLCKSIRHASYSVTQAAAGMNQVEAEPSNQRPDTSVPFVTGLNQVYWFFICDRAFHIISDSSTMCNLSFFIIDLLALYISSNNIFISQIKKQWTIWTQNLLGKSFCLHLSSYRYRLIFLTNQRSFLTRHWQHR